jgi:hypothetical protein
MPAWAGEQEGVVANRTRKPMSFILYARGVGPCAGCLSNPQTSHRRAYLWGLALLLGLCVTALWPTAGGMKVAAQESAAPLEAPVDAGLQIQQLRIQVMPEFDDPRVLVIVQGRLAAPGAELPLPITFRLPKGAQINQMATMNMSTGGTNPQPYDVQSDPDDPRWLLVTYTLDNAHFFYEYYHDSLVGDVDKQLHFSFSSLQPVGDLLLEVQQPLAATDFSLDPSPTTTHLDQALDLAFHQIKMGALAAGQETSVGVSYTKTDPAPSLPAEVEMPPQMEKRLSTRPAFESVRSSREPVPGWVFILMANVALVILGAFVWHRRQSTRTLMVPVLAGDGNPPCRRCGTIVKTGASFCHTCGASVKAVLGQQVRVRYD